MSYFFIINHSVHDRTKEGRKENERKEENKEGRREGEKEGEKERYRESRYRCRSYKDMDRDTDVED